MDFVPFGMSAAKHFQKTDLLLQFRLISLAVIIACLAMQNVLQKLKKILIAHNF